MGARQLRPLVEGGMFFEAPRRRAGRWWISNFYRHAVFAIDPGGREEEILHVEEPPSRLGFRPDGPPDFAEANRMAAREAILFTTTVDVPHGGRP